MLPATLLLERYYVEEFSFAPSEEALTSGTIPLDPTPDDIEVGIELWNHPKEDRKVACRLFIGIANNSKNGIAYTVDMTLMGIFKIVESYPAERIQPMVRYNAPALLYSAAREYVALTTGRGVAGPLTLPTISFIERKDVSSPQDASEEQIPDSKVMPQKVGTRKKKTA